MLNTEMKMLQRIAILLAVTLVAACGGGGGSSGASSFSNAASGVTDTTAANLDLQLSTATIDNSGAASVTATATATTAVGQAVSGVPVTFSVDNHAIFSVAGTATAANGQLSATVLPGSDPSNRLVTVTVTSGSLTKSASFAVTGAKLTGTVITVNPAPGSTGNRVDFRLVNANSNPIVGQAITVTAGSLAPVTGVTGAAGDYTYTYTAPTTPGPLDITATAGGTSNTQTVSIASVATVPMAGCPASGACQLPISVLSASVSANPSVIATNTPSTNNRTEIRALFVGSANTPVQNVRVRFDLAGDPASIGGKFSAGDNTASGDGTVVYSDSNGIATTAYIPGTRASPTNGVIIRACYDVVDFSTCTTAAQTTITVAADPLAVTIGSNENVYIGPNDLTYIRKFVILVVDSSGRAKGNVDIVPSVDIDRYYKGQYVHSANWFLGYEVQPKTIPPTLVSAGAAQCFNEDINRNGINEAAEDINNSHSLEPRKSDVAVSILGTGKTDSSGSATVQIEYPKNVATWARVNILVAATGISGTEGRATWTEVLPAPVTAFTASGAPAFVVSPYGVEIFDVTANFTTPNPAGATVYKYTDGTIIPPGTDVFQYPDGTIVRARLTAAPFTPCENPY